MDVAAGHVAQKHDGALVNAVAGAECRDPLRQASQVRFGALLGNGVAVLAPALSLFGVGAFANMRVAEKDEGGNLRLLAGSRGRQRGGAPIVRAVV